MIENDEDELVTKAIEGVRFTCWNLIEVNECLASYGSEDKPLHTHLLAFQYCPSHVINPDASWIIEQWRREIIKDFDGLRCVTEESFLGRIYQAERWLKDIDFSSDEAIVPHYLF